MTLGRPHIHHAVIDSTNALLKRLADEGATSGTLVTADEQTAGRGRQGRSWVAPPGSALLMSVLVRPLEARHVLAPLAAGVAVAETCETFSDLPVAIKWPNDVWLGGRKVAGILAEARPDPDPAKSWLVVGIGLNTAVDLGELPAELRQTAASLGLPRHHDALAPLLKRLDRRLGAEPAETIEAWRDRDVLFGREISWAGGSGLAAGIDDDGNLLVRGCGAGITTLRAGEVHLTLH